MSVWIRIVLKIFFRQKYTVTVVYSYTKFGVTLAEEQYLLLWGGALAEAE